VLQLFSRLTRLNSQNLPFAILPFVERESATAACVYASATLHGIPKQRDSGTKFVIDDNRLC